MSVEGRRRRVVQIHAGEHAYLVAELALQFLGDGLEALGSVRRHVDDPTSRLAARGDGGGRGSGIGAERGAVVGVLGTDDREVHEAHALDGRFFPALLGTVEVGRRLNLRVAHAVADEEEHVLRRHGRRASLRPAFTGGGHGHRTWLVRSAPEQRPQRRHPRQACRPTQEVATGNKIWNRIIYHEKSFLEFYLLANNSTIDRHRKTPVSRKENL